MYLKKFYHDDPIFEKSKVVYSFYNQPFSGNLGKGLVDKMKLDGYLDKELKGLENGNFKELSKTAINFYLLIYVNRNSS